MKCFVVGTVLEPDVMSTKDGKQHVNFGFLSGKESIVLDVWQDDVVFSKAAVLREGDRVILILRPAVDSRGNLKFYVSNIAEAPDGLRATLLDLFIPPAAVADPKAGAAVPPVKK